MINRKLLTRTIQVLALIMLMLVLFNSCQDANPMSTETEVRLTTQNFHTMAPGELPQPMIVGGYPVDPACPDCKYDFMVSLQTNSGYHFCGGALVREDWVITAAHCVQGDSPSQVKVKIGLHNVNGTQGSITRNVSQIIIHPSYSSWSLNNDYAILQLSQPVTNFEPIQLVTDTSHDEEPVMATTMGWGATSSGGSSSNILLEVDVPIDDSCGNYSNSDITNNMVCAGDFNGGEDSCQGDSGGPLIMTNSDGEYELIGIVSWGYGCAEAGYPGVYSRIYPRLDWFFSYIGEPEEDEILLGDLNFDELLNISDVVLVINMILNPDDIYIPEMYTAADMNQDGVINVLDVIGLVSQILGTTMRESIDWLEENFPQLKTKERLSKLDKSQFFAKKSCCSEKPEEINCVKLRAKYEKLLIEHENLKTRHRLLKKLDLDKQRIIQKLSENK